MVVRIYLVPKAFILARWRRVQNRGNPASWLVPLIAGVGAWSTMVWPLRGPLGPAGFLRLNAGLGLGLWSGWIGLAGITRWDFAWHLKLRPWTRRAGFWASYAIGAALGPTSPAILGCSAAALLAMAVTMNIALPRIPLVALVLWLFILCTLRLTSLAIALTRPGARAAIRACGLGIALGLAAWNGVAHGLPPMHWLVRSTYAPPGEALECVAGFLALLAVLVGLDAWLTLHVLLQGHSERTARKFGADLLLAGSGRRQALRRGALLGWLRLPVFDALMAFLVVFSVAIPLLDRKDSDTTGWPIFLCGLVLAIGNTLRGNLLGTDASGAWRYSSVGVPPSDVLAQRSLVLSAVQAATLAPIVAFTIVWRPWGWAGIAALAAFLVATFALQDAAGLLLSRAFPEPMKRTEYGSGTSTTGTNIMVFGFLAWTILFLLAVLATAPSPWAALWPAAVAGACIVARAFVARALRRQSGDAWGDRILSRLGAIWL